MPGEIHATSHDSFISCGTQGCSDREACEIFHEIAIDFVPAPHTIRLRTRKQNWTGSEPNISETPTPPPNGPRLPMGLMAVGSEMAGATVFGVVLDLFVFKTLPWCTIGFTIFGFIAAFYHMILMAKASAVRPGGPPRQRATDESTDDP